MESIEGQPPPAAAAAVAEAVSTTTILVVDTAEESRLPLGHAVSIPSQVVLVPALNDGSHYLPNAVAVPTPPTPIVSSNRIVGTTGGYVTQEVTLSPCNQVVQHSPPLRGRAYRSSRPNILTSPPTLMRRTTKTTTCHGNHHHDDHTAGDYDPAWWGRYLYDSSLEPTDDQATSIDDGLFVHHEANRRCTHVLSAREACRDCQPRHVGESLLYNGPSRVATGSSTTTLLHSKPCTPLGPPNLKIFHQSLPAPLKRDEYLNWILQSAEHYVATTLSHGWITNLYSLTQQDVPVHAIPGLGRMLTPIQDYVLHQVQCRFGHQGRSVQIRLDSNQPHILKYDASTPHYAGKRGVELHFDRCDVTVLLALNARNEYTGGGTYYPSLGKTVVLERGEFIMHPGSLLHAGNEISSGQRFLLVYFCHLEYW